MDRRTFQKDFNHTNHRKYPKWGRLGKIKDFRKVHAIHTAECCMEFAEIVNNKYPRWIKYPPYKKGDKHA